MLVQEKAFLLSRIPYSENSTIIYCFTELNGYKSFIFKGSKKKNSSYIQTMSPLLLYYNKSNIDKLEVVHNVEFFINPISFDSSIMKSGIIFFQNEILRNVLINGQSDSDLFNFVLREYIWLNENEYLSNYMFFWLFECISHLGFSPDNFKEKICENDNLFHLYKKKTKEEFINLKLSEYEKELLLNIILLYYKLKIPNFKNINSVLTFKEIWI